MFIYNARAYGLDFAKSLLSRAVRYKYANFLKEDMQTLSFNLPGVIYEHCFRNVYTRFYNRLQDLFNKGQQLALSF